MTPQEIHHRDAEAILRSIIEPTLLEAGGNFNDVMVLLESVTVGVMLFGRRLGASDEVIDRTLSMMVKQVRRRFAMAGAGDVKGHA